VYRRSFVESADTPDWDTPRRSLLSLGRPSSESHPFEVGDQALACSRSRRDQVLIGPLGALCRVVPTGSRIVTSATSNDLDPGVRVAHRLRCTCFGRHPFRRARCGWALTLRHRSSTGRLPFARGMWCDCGVGIGLRFGIAFPFRMEHMVVHSPENDRVRGNR
jgi:hypothetical protein